MDTPKGTAVAFGGMAVGVAEAFEAWMPASAALRAARLGPGVLAVLGLLGAAGVAVADSNPGGGRCIPLDKIEAPSVSQDWERLAEADRRRISDARRRSPEIRDAADAVVVGPSSASSELTILLSERFCDGTCPGWFITSNRKRTEIVPFAYKRDMYVFGVARDRNGKLTYRRFYRTYLFSSRSGNDLIVIPQVTTNKDDPSEVGKVLKRDMSLRLLTQTAAHRNVAFRCLHGAYDRIL